MTNLPQWLNQIEALYLSNKVIEALELTQQGLKLFPNDLTLLSHAGAFALMMDRINEAEDYFQRTLTIQPNLPSIHNNLGILFRRQNRFTEAEAAYRQALIYKPDYLDAYCNLGNLLHQQYRFKDAELVYRRILKLQPDSSFVWNNLGLLLHQQHRIKDAKRAYHQAIKYQPENPEFYYNMAVLLQKIGDFDSAITVYQKALLLQPNYPQIYYNLGLLMKELGHFEQSQNNYQKALALKPDYWPALIHLFHQKHQMCDWKSPAKYHDSLAQYKTKLLDKVIENDMASPSFPLLAMLDEPEIHHQAAVLFGRQFVHPKREQRVHGPTPTIKIAYLSSDFHAHATAYLMAELFELHDNNRFEIYAFSYGQHNEQTEIRRRLEAAFTQFFDVEHQSDFEIAEQIQALDIHIAIDLKGYTTGSRTGILASRPAPIQIQYVGYPGTLGLPFIDYMIADPVVIAKEERLHYLEKIIFLPDCYQPNDRKREVASVVPTRNEMGLPDTGVVFACFNSNYKITKEQFDIWCQILKAVPDSVLWLLEHNSSVVANLQERATQQGVDSERLVFATKIPLDQHLARISLSTLFLDTHPYNAHTTASDSLWVGVPVLTKIGRSFAARVAASLLQAIGVPELIVNNDEDYIQKAIELANQPDKIANIKAKILTNIKTNPLFDTPHYVSHLERAYEQVWKRHLDGESPADIHL